jgi:hypothetical protein
MTHCTGVAQLKAQVIQKNHMWDKAGRKTLKRQMFGRRHQMKLECKNGMEQRPETGATK